MRLVALMKSLEEEKNSLIKSNITLLDKCSLLEKEKESYVENINFLTKQKMKARESKMEFTMTIIQLKSDLNRFSSSSSKLDKMLGLGQTSKFELGYE